MAAAPPDDGKHGQLDTSAGQAVYSPFTLAAYDLVVLRLTNRFIWQCPSSRLLEHYNRNVSGEHLDVGVGTGYFVDKCRFPVPDPHITLFDLNSSSLSRTAQRIQRFHPTMRQGDVLQPLSFEPASFDSIGLNFLLHCLPGTMETKAVAFDNLMPLLKAGGVVFGSSVVNGGVQHGAVSHRLMNFYNRHGIFCNAQDDVAGLQRLLAERFSASEVSICGRVALFSARV